MRKVAVATIIVGVLAVTACTSDNGIDSTAPDNADSHAVVGPVNNETEVSEQLDEFLLSSQGVASWDEATDGWGRDVTGTEVNGFVLLVHTTLVNERGAVGDAARISDEVVRLISGHPAADQLGRVTVSYHAGRGAYSAHL